MSACNESTHLLKDRSMDDTIFKHHHVRQNGLRQHFATAGKGRAVMFLHGFPDLWRTWRPQIKAVVDASYMAIAPDLRGYGETEGTADAQAATCIDVMGDLVSIMDHLEVPEVTLVAHDWAHRDGRGLEPSIAYLRTCQPKSGSVGARCRGAWTAYAASHRR